MKDDDTILSTNTPEEPLFDRPGVGSGPAPYRPGDIIGSDYRLLELIGKGGMGTVFRAQHTLMQSVYALKILLPDLVTAATWMRFQKEAQALSKLNHPNIVQIYNMGVDRERSPYYVMELLEGHSLSQEISKNGQISFGQCVSIFLQIASALAFSHKQGVVHRDVKPSNVMLIGDEQSFSGVKLVDFGIAKTQYLSGYESQSLTTTGEIFGTQVGAAACRGGEIIRQKPNQNR
jgi:serine/threonine protein kinase